ncbi:MAG: GTPase domain-containing protein [Candidatus Heimdallarchaeota archaeon]|nr:GTPase domain-containing protein [Candidatus Heimdallarchaeota archaeon]MDH5647866.1 GTPase domain-containing protein [Candidatus Heimdallarchaeota archaeon]
MTFSNFGKISEHSKYLNYIKRTKNIRKVLLVGSGAVGKTSIVKVFKEKSSLTDLRDYELKYHRTHFLDLESIKIADLVEKEVEGVITFVDVAGQLDLPIHALRDITRTTLGAVDLVFLVFAQDNVNSFLELSKWVDIIEAEKTVFEEPSEVKYFLIQNKADSSGKIAKTLIDQVIQMKPTILHHFVISCVSGEGIVELQKALVKELFGGK